VREIFGIESLLAEYMGFIDYLLRSNYDQMLDLGHEYYP